MLDEDSQMHDLTLLLALFAAALLAYQGEADDRPPVQDDDWLDADPSNVPAADEQVTEADRFPHAMTTRIERGR